MFPHREVTKREKACETVSRIRKVLVVVLATLGLFFGTVAAANATDLSWKPGGDCTNLTNRYQYSVYYGPHDVRMVSWASRSDSWNCVRVYTGGGQTIDTTMQVVRICSTGSTVLGQARYTGYRTVAVWVTRATAASCSIVVKAWTFAGFGEEDTMVNTAHA